MGLTSLCSSFPSARRGGTSELPRKELFHNFFCFISLRSTNEFVRKMGLTSLRSSFPSARRGGTSELSRKELFHNFFCFYIPPLRK